MTTKSTAAEAIRRLATQYQQMMEAADLLEKIGSMDLATEEAKAARATAEKERDAVQDEVKKAKAELKVAQEKAKLVLAEASTKAAEMAERAGLDAQSAAKDSTAKASQILDSANTRASLIIKSAEKTQDEMQAAVQAATFERDRINAEAADAEDRLAKANKQLDTVRAKLTALLGGE